jgi:hypothetical protein
VTEDVVIGGFQVDVVLLEVLKGEGRAVVSVAGGRRGEGEKTDRVEFVRPQDFGDLDELVEVVVTLELCMRAGSAGRSEREREDRPPEAKRIDPR